MTLEEYREKTGMTRPQLAEFLCVSTATVYEWMKGRKPYRNMAEWVYKRTNMQVKPEEMGWTYE